MNISYINKKLKETLSEHRYTHSVGTAEEAKKLAKHYHVSQQSAYLAGLLHDCAKSLSIEAMRDLLKEDGYNEDFLQCKSIMHAPAGEKIAAQAFKVSNCDILNAIRYHCYAREKMSMLEKIVYVADKIEPTRHYSGVEKLRELAYENIDRALLISVNYTVSKIREQNGYLHDNTLEAKKYYEYIVDNKVKL